MSQFGFIYSECTNNETHTYVTIIVCCQAKMNLLFLSSSMYSFYEGVLIGQGQEMVGKTGDTAGKSNHTISFHCKRSKTGVTV